ncbi:50S ribosomal protein L25/general stress protein Ctc [Empedobacter stercoris]|uniref:Large ribosomal subunit protein bL25 n=2 Tax=Empedobacter TaxID=59734 RepID=A0ABY8V4V6_9FLAO|nr:MULTISPECIES: 50S ribosomal protein L25/general stress protein Ctc [Empedobacter]MCA4775855.1 50S ribosomal protein L25/general stress protein Ctc [Empedobacter stercoris]MCA4808854.1 50S ribosomal protein L25/general stress protein Ctc [Empedobacter stercoris]MDM1523317.1 50S ribosomal protein L25/general stress protein Ctc [Empedobacter sp. 225-1]MDM1541790.1 50S ribosomal protein L25/general stress protein Ctc [Empedobacter sp. 189-2]NOJ76367.1 50S ribosomal protein L25/general stress pr
MKSITIQGVKREDLGKVATRNLRNAEQVPCVVYGSGEPIHFSAEEKAFKSLVYTPEAHTVTIELADGAKVQAILQDIQFHPVTDRILHVDFYQLSDDKAVTMEVPVRLVGRARGLVAGGVLRFNMRKLKVRAIPANLPDEIEIDITPMRIGHKMYVESLKNDKYTFAHPDNAVVVAIRTSRNAVKDADQDEDEE